MRTFRKDCQAKKKSLMIQGTASNVGKSTLVVALAAAFRKRGLRVYPFKPQNMSNNAAATKDGEMARAQVLQAYAAGVEPEVAMNPILLKPQGDSKSQLVVMGKAKGVISGNEWRRLRAKYGRVVLEAFESLRAKADLVLVEGAGSPAEINLRKGDIANMGFATMAGVPTLLVADIHQGGSGAAVVGTMAFLSEAEKALLKGYVLNRFRGNKELLGDLPAQIKQRCGLDCLGVLPFVAEASNLPLEDSLALDQSSNQPVAPVHTQTDATGGATGEVLASAQSGAQSGIQGGKGGTAGKDGMAGKAGTAGKGGMVGKPSKRVVKVAVARLPFISNFDDIDPLKADSRFEVAIVDVKQTALPAVDLVLLCGSKAVRSDLAVLKKSGWETDIKAHIRRGGSIIGICGGYQMLGTEVSDPEGLEGSKGKTKGLGLLPIATTLTKHKQVRQCEAVVDGIRTKGYLIHQGKTVITQSPETNQGVTQNTNPKANQEAFAVLDNQTIGIKRHKVAGCYLHGLFGSAKWRDHLYFALTNLESGGGRDHQEIVLDAIDLMANTAQSHLDLTSLWELAQQNS